MLRIFRSVLTAFPLIFLVIGGCGKKSQKATGFTSAAAKVTKNPLTSSSTASGVQSLNAQSAITSLPSTAISNEEQSLIEATYGDAPPSNIPILATTLKCKAKGSSYEYDPINGCIQIFTNQQKQTCAITQWSDTLGCIPTSTTIQVACTNANLYWVNGICNHASALTQDECNPTNGDNLQWYEGRCFNNENQVSCLQGEKYWFETTSNESCLASTELSQPLCQSYAPILSWINGACGPNTSDPTPLNLSSLSPAPLLNALPLGPQIPCDLYDQSSLLGFAENGCYTSPPIAYQYCRFYNGISTNYGIGCALHTSPLPVTTASPFPTSSCPIPYATSISVQIQRAAQNSFTYTLTCGGGDSKTPSTVRTINVSTTPWTTFNFTSSSFSFPSTSASGFIYSLDFYRTDGGNTNRRMVDSVHVDSNKWAADLANFNATIKSSTGLYLYWPFAITYCSPPYSYIAGIFAVDIFPYIINHNGIYYGYQSPSFVCSQNSTPPTSAPCYQDFTSNTQVTRKPDGTCDFSTSNSQIYLKNHFQANQITSSTPPITGVQSTNLTIRWICPTGLILNFNAQKGVDGLLSGFTIDCGVNTIQSTSPLFGESGDEEIATLSLQGDSSLSIFQNQSQLIGLGIGNTRFGSSASPSSTLTCAEGSVPVGVNLTLTSQKISQLGLVCGQWITYPDYELSLKSHSQADKITSSTPAITGGKSIKSTTQWLCPTGQILKFNLTSDASRASIKGFTIDCGVNGTVQSTSPLFGSSGPYTNTIFLNGKQPLFIYYDTAQVITLDLQAIGAATRFGVFPPSSTSLACASGSVPVGINVEATSTSIVQLGLACGQWTPQ